MNLARQNKASTLLAYFMLSLLLTGCAPRILSICDAPVRTGKNDHSEEEVLQAITRASQREGWGTRTQSRRKLIATRAVKSMEAVVAIQYDTRSYSVTYHDSKNLGYVWRPVSDYGGTIQLGATDQGEVKKEYNDWVGALKRSIDEELARVR